MPICSIFGCADRPGVDKTLSFYKLPKIITNQGEKTQELSQERQRLWKAAINRRDITHDDKRDGTIGCSKHFVRGNVQLLSEIFLDSDFCHNYLQTPIKLN